MKICVHSGKFHANDVLSVFLLKSLDEYKNAEVIRTRDMEVINNCDIVCDVGGVYDHDKKRYDHHQTNFFMTYPNRKVPLSSCGLIYLHYGERAIREILKKNNRDAGKYIQFLIDSMYDNFVQEIDAIDNGFSQVEGRTSKYVITSDISSRIDYLNIRSEENMKEFNQAIDLIGEEFTFRLLRYCDCDVPAAEVTQKAYDSRFDVDPSGHIMVLSEFCDPRPHLKYIEKPDQPLIYFYLRQDGNLPWRIQTVEYPGSFKPRVRLPYGGLMEEDLSKACGIPGGKFCHKTGFLGVFYTYEGALAFARLALEKNLK
ncbi:hypothetical protein TVAG_488660 [Trichomonas vaginalis G3]|uniref:Metal-dependent protein hydrolase n=1 Tax=Trichomonas vaginalis (strain ATCC PRA-98 / G3) TaxID=412133 RepID=A2FXE9_TRIV3|nr:locomotory exploration behavior [Trichomonas vaginalis G3]EAX90412.1 hypothetical protein TVAG_488660 [Trichomonas vaginalis G3]KAI5536846.1 locomotory exploration behavior [Trichomonas vaginalis G3]|eukprot:XP_001303342.1 hypothetical protein [Trichomonas vaginalis G3]